jgi:bifunctional polynucleotide phosphatase/kinase
MNPKDSPVYYKSYKNPSWTSKIAAFDLDSTLILARSSKKSPLSTNESDWIFWHFSVPSRLKDLHDKGYTLVIFTNQAGIAASDSLFKRFTKKIEAIFQRLELPIHLYAALKLDFNRKPLLGMWERMLHESSGVEIREWFYVGDAAGRPKDHSDCDLKFAKNIEAKFFETPEQFFLGDKSIQFMQLTCMKPLTFERKQPVKLNFDFPCVVLLLGTPAGSGRWSFVNQELKEAFNEIPFDYLEPAKNIFAKQKFLEIISSGTSVVLKASFPSAKERSYWICKAKEKKFSVYCLVFTSSLDFEFAKQMDLFKGIDSKNFDNSIVLHKTFFQKTFSEFNQKLEYPTLQEGFDQVVEVSYVHPNPLFGKIFI